LAEQLKTNGFSALKTLVNNQPQLVFTVEYRSRDELAGRNETSAKFSYEWGMYSVNATRKSRECNGDITPSCLRTYLAKYGKQIAAGPRFAFSLIYSLKDEYDFNETGFPTLALDSERSIIDSLSYSRNARIINTSEPTHIELAMSYEDISNDPMRNSRGLANLTLTQTVLGTQLSFGAVYASKPEYRGSVDEEISARLGLVYKLGKD